MDNTEPTPKLNDVLAELQIELARKLLERVKTGAATAADLNVARQLLKDNDIQSATRQANPALGDLRLVLPFDEEVA